MIVYGVVAVAVRAQGRSPSPPRRGSSWSSAGRSPATRIRNSSRRARSARCRAFATAISPSPIPARSSHYLEAVKPEPNLIPKEPQGAARGRSGSTNIRTRSSFACGGKMFFNRIVGPRFLGVPGDEEIARKAECDELPPLLDYLERVIPASGFLVEDRLTLADISVASPFANLDHLGCRDRRRPPSQAQGLCRGDPRAAELRAAGSQQEKAFLERTAAVGPDGPPRRGDRLLPRPCLFRGRGAGRRRRGGCAKRVAERFAVRLGTWWEKTGRPARPADVPDRLRDRTCSRPWCPG